MVVRHPERIELRSVPPGPDPQPQAPAADLIDRGRELGKDRWTVESRARDERTEFDALGRLRDSREGRPGFPRREPGTGEWVAVRVVSFITDSITQESLPLPHRSSRSEAASPFPSLSITASQRALHCIKGRRYSPCSRGPWNGESSGSPLYLFCHRQRSGLYIDRTLIDDQH